MGLKDKLMAKSADVKAQVDAEIARTPEEKPAHPRTAIGHTGAFQIEIMKSEQRIKELEARVKDLESTAISVAAISPNPWQPRRVFDEAEIQKLAGSIAEIGLIQPVIVRSVPNMDTQYQLVAGERRWRAYQLLGKSDIKAIVIEATDEEMAALALAENFDREDLTAFEIALAIKNSETAFPSRKNLASALGINRTDLYRYLSFFQLPDFVVDDLNAMPGLLGRHAAEEIVAMLKKHGQSAVDVLRRIWPRVKSGDLDQGKIASLIETSISRGSQAPIQRDIRKLFIGKEQAGSIMRDSGKLKIEIKASALTPEREAELRQFVERMFANEE